jgi:hypothetical protein
MKMGLDFLWRSSFEGFGRLHSGGFIQSTRPDNSTHRCRFFF